MKEQNPLQDRCLILSQSAWASCICLGTYFGQLIILQVISICLYPYLHLHCNVGSLISMYILVFLLEVDKYGCCVQQAGTWVSSLLAPLHQMGLLRPVRNKHLGGADRELG